MTKSTDVHESACPTCGAIADVATATYNPEAMPKPGDIGICLHCGNPMVFTDELRLRNPTKAEKRRMAKDPRLAELEHARRMTVKR
jgi:ribosomal protein S3